MNTEKRYAVISDGVVINKIIWNEDKGKWKPPESTIIVEITQDDVDIGSIYNKRKKIFSPPLK